MHLVKNDGINAFQFGANLLAYEDLGRQTDYRAADLVLFTLANRHKYVCRIACGQAAYYDQYFPTRMAFYVSIIVVVKLKKKEYSLNLNKWNLRNFRGIDKILVNSERNQ